MNVSIRGNPCQGSAEAWKNRRSASPRVWADAEPGVGFGICFKIKRPDYGSGQLERDLIFLQLKDLFYITFRARAMPCQNPIIGPFLAVAGPISSSGLDTFRVHS